MNGGLLFCYRYRLLVARHSYGGIGVGSTHNPFVPLARRALTLPTPYSRRIDPIAPASALLDEFLIEIHTIRLEYRS